MSTFERVLWALCLLGSSVAALLEDWTFATYLLVLVVLLELWADKKGGKS